MLRGRQTGLDLSAVQTPAPLKPAKRPHRNESRPRVTCERRGLVSVRLADGGCVGSFSLEGFLGPSGGIPRSCLSVPFTSAPMHVFEQEQWQSGPSRCQKWQAVSEKRHDCVHTGPRGVRMSLRSCSTVRKPSPAPNEQTNKQTRGNGTAFLEFRGSSGNDTLSASEAGERGGRGGGSHRETGKCATGALREGGAHVAWGTKGLC